MITKQLLINFRKDFAETVKTLEDKYGVVINLSHISYGITNFNCKLEVNEGASKEEVNEQLFEQNCWKYGLVPDDFNKRFMYAGYEYCIVGIKTNKRKYPICCRKIANGQTYNFGIELIKRLI